MARRIAIWVFDLHGVLIARAAGAPPDPGGVIEQIRRSGSRVLFVTNSSTMGPGDLVDALAREGVAADETEVASAGMAAGDFVGRYHPSARVLVVGKAKLSEMVRAAAPSARLVDRGPADVVVVARLSAVPPDLLRDAAAAVRAGATFVATSTEARVPGASGWEDGPGGTVSAVSQMAGAQPLVIGKPNPYILQRLFGLGPADLERTAVVGDCWETDGALALAIGGTSVLVSPRGAGRQSQLPAHPGHWVIDDVSGLGHLIACGAEECTTR